MKRNPSSGHLLVVLLYVSLVAGVLVSRFYEASNIDFFYYWSVGRLAVSGENPYDAAQVVALQQTYDPRATIAITAWNPPWVLPLFMVYGLFSYPVAHALQLFSAIALLFASTTLIWKTAGGPGAKTWVAILFAITFAPVLFSFFEGQSNLLVLVGLAGFLYFERRSPFVAGVFTILILVKPHLLYLFWLALLYWVVSKRQWRVLAGASLTFVFFNGTAFVFNPQIFQHYIDLMQNPQLTRLPTASLYSLIYSLTGQPNSLALYIPLAFGLVYLFYLLYKNRAAWQWQTQIPGVMFGSLLTIPFAWMHDEILLLIPLIQIVAAVQASQVAGIRRLWLGLYVVVNAICITLIPILRFEQYLFYWAPWTFLVLYLLVNNRLKQPAGAAQPPRVAAELSG